MKPVLTSIAPPVPDALLWLNSSPDEGGAADDVWFVALNGPPAVGARVVVEELGPGKVACRLE